MNIKDETSIPFAHPVYIRSILDCLNGRGIRPSTVLTSAGLAWQDLHEGQQMVDFTSSVDLSRMPFIAAASRRSG